MAAKEETMTTESTESPLERGERLLARIWRLIAARGVVAVAFGVVLIVWPDIGLTTMTALVGIFALASGFVSGVAAFSLSAESKQHRIWLAIDAIAGLAVGLAVLVWPDLSAKALLYAIAIWAIASGGIQLAGAFVLPLRSAWSLLLALSGIVMAAFGIVMFVEPGDGAIALLSLVAAFAIVGGSFDIALAVELRRATAELKERFRRSAPAKPVAHG